jgi:hypothetical protein
MTKKRTTGRPMGRPKKKDPGVKRNVVIPTPVDTMIAKLAEHSGLSYSFVLAAIAQAWGEANLATIDLGATGEDHEVTIVLPLKWRSDENEGHNA